MTQAKVSGTKVMSISSLSSGLGQTHSLPPGNSFAAIISKLNELLFGSGEVYLGEGELPTQLAVKSYPEARTEAYYQAE